MIRGAMAGLVAFLLIGLAAGSSCSNGAGKLDDEEVEYWLAGPDETSERAGDRTSVLLFKIAKSHDKLRELFDWEFASGLKFFDASHQRWRQQFNTCGNSDCRYQLARRELNRLNFTLNRASMPVPGMPFRNGFFDDDAEDRAGAVYLFPLDDGRFLLGVRTMMLDQGAGICAHMAAGELPIRGATLVTTLPDEEFPEIEDTHVMKLEVHSDRELTIAPPNGEDSTSWPCTVLGDIYGKYSLAH